MSAQGGQALVAAERAGQADQDGRPFGAALPSIDLSVVRGVGSSTVVPGSVGSYRPVIAGAKLREGTTTILPRGRALQGVGLSSMRFHPIGGGPKTTKRDKKHGSRQETHPLLERPAQAGPDYDAIISFGLPIEPEDSQYGEYRLIWEILVKVLKQLVRSIRLGDLGIAGKHLYNPVRVDTVQIACILNGLPVGVRS